MPRKKQVGPQKSKRNEPSNGNLLSDGLPVASTSGASVGIVQEVIVIVSDEESSDTQPTLAIESSLLKEIKGSPKKKKTEEVTDAVLQEYLNDCTFYFTIKNLISQSNTNDKISPHILGHIPITLSSPHNFQLPYLQDVPVLYVYISQTPNKCLLYLEHSSKVSYWPVTCFAPYDVLNCLKNRRLFSLGLMCSKESASLQFNLCIYILHSGFTNLNHPSDSKQNQNLHPVVTHFFGYAFPDVLPSSNRPAWPYKNTQELYDSLRTLQANSHTEAIISLPLHDLLPCLRPYQEDAVKWMLTREVNACKQDALHCLYQECRLPSGQNVYVNKYSGILSLQKPLAVQKSPGGILADEMGLGKTVEVLACILSHPRPANFFEELKCESSQDQTDSSELSNEDICVAGNLKSSHPNVPVMNWTSEIFNSQLVKNKDDLQSDGVESTSQSVIAIDDNNSRFTKLKRKRSSSSESSSTETELSDNETEINFETKISENHTEDQTKITACKNESGNSREFFECLCGYDHWQWEWVQCTSCGSYQHKKCIDFGEEMDEAQYLCPHCWVSQDTPLAKSRATLVVTPSSIRTQWEEEIERHLSKGTLKWMFYPGMGQRSSRFMQPLHLADHDLVLVTYETLSKEIDYVDLPHSNSDSGRRLRHPKRFMATPTPLLAVEWWRVCLDEAQMVEGVTSKTAEMALRLSAVNKWCVTGTPIQKSINDLFGLLLFLGVDPFWQKHWWDKLLYEPYRTGLAQPLLEVLRDCFWRNTKKDVLHQIDLPPQNETTYKLLFSPVEEHFYHRQYQECSQDALQRLNKFSNLGVKLRALDKQTMSQVMFPLSRLRQACCHPQAVRGHFLPLQKTTMTMEDLLTSLIKKTKLECEEFHRQFLFALNGLAGIFIINEEYVAAVQKYREVLRSVKEQNVVLKTDKLQQIHTLYNLSKILKGEITHSDCPESMDDKSPAFLRCLPEFGQTLEDNSLEKEYETLQDNYLRKYQGPVASAQEQLNKARTVKKEVEGKFEGEGENWWALGCQQIARAGLGEALVQRVKDTLLDKKIEEKTKHKDTFSDRFNSINGLQMLLIKSLDDLKKSRDSLACKVLSLPIVPTKMNVTEAVYCHLRPLLQTPDKCVYCKCHELFDKYEGQLFFVEEGFEKESLDKIDGRVIKLRRGTWADSQLETVLKAILSFLKLHRLNHGLIENGINHLKWFDVLKKEFKGLRAVWIQIRDYASALDELEMGKLRMRLCFEGEIKPEVKKGDSNYILEPHEVQPTKLKLMSDRIIAENEVKKKLGHLFYLKNLEKTDFGCKGGSNPDTCPICQKKLGTKWSVIKCGHCFCMDCIQILILQYPVGAQHSSVRCAVCRDVTRHAEISYVDTKADQSKLEQETVKGSHSTKVEAVVRCLLKIKREDPEAKSLVFSSWKSVLLVLEEALAGNDIPNVSFESQKLAKSLWHFKHDPEIKVLLLPVHSGANGLNLIEATHVLMVEPLLNPAAELQALGRVHRIGQTKPTMVHRFIVCSTIEERIHHASANHSNENEDDMTLEELKKLFEEK